ncbi:MAG: hypothetical protein NT103_07535 [Campylobacterales bacterium]|nr:hypothetical protein [Campylobacterales bacterium]
MRKSIILASLLFASSAFSEQMCTLPSGQSWFYVGQSDLPDSAYICDTCGSSSGCTAPNLFCGGNYMLITAQTGPDPVYHDCSYVRAIYNIKPTVDCVPSDGCKTGLDDLTRFQGNQAGCNGAGGYYFADGSCNTGSQAIKKIFQDPAAVVGAMLSIGGITFSGTGVLAAAAFSATPVGAVTVGTLATLAGVGSLAVAAGSKFDWSSAPSPDVISGETRIKINLTTSGGSAVTSTNTTTGKVDSVTTVPPQTLDAMKNSGYVDVSTGTLTAPIPLDGTQTTNYDYGTNTATTTTYEAGSTSSNPITTTKTTPITVTQNPDGTVTTTPNDPTVAPTVSGSGGGSVVSSSTTSGTGGTGSGTGGSTGNGPDYTGVLNEIKNNTGKTASTLDQIKAFFDGSGKSNTELKDGSDGFNGLENDVKGSFNGFLYTDPLGLNALGGSYAVPTFSFNMLGHNFVLFNQASLDHLPFSAIRSLFLFIAALAGLITVVSGV